MPLEQTLERVEREIASGDLAAARDRLLGLLSTYPSDLHLRERLGAVYWRLGDRPMAGRYWYLAENPNDEIRRAIEAFERSCGGDEVQILRCLKFRGDLAELAPGYARRRLEALGWRGRRSAPGGHAVQSASGISSTVAGYGCMLVLALFATFAMIGLVTVLRFIF